MFFPGAGFVDDYGVAVLRGVFLNDDCIGSIRDDAAGEDSCGLSGSDGLIERPSGGDFSDDFEPRRGRHQPRGRHNHPSPTWRRGLGAQRRDVAGACGDAPR
jgi:hypothetical protein